MHAIDGGSSDAPDATAGGGGSGSGQLVDRYRRHGGVYYPLGGGLANVISDNIEARAPTIWRRTRPSTTCCSSRRRADIAFVLGDTASDASAGPVPTSRAHQVDACALGSCTTTTPSSSRQRLRVSTVADLQGKRVSLGSPGSGTEIIGLRILEAAGLDPDTDIERLSSACRDRRALRDGTIDAASGPGPADRLARDYATTGEMVLIPTGEYASAISDSYGSYYLEYAIPADHVRGMDDDVSTVSCRTCSW